MIVTKWWMTFSNSAPNWTQVWTLFPQSILLMLTYHHKLSSIKFYRLYSGWPRSQWLDFTQMWWTWFTWALKNAMCRSQVLTYCTYSKKMIVRIPVWSRSTFSLTVSKKRFSVNQATCQKQTPHSWPPSTFPNSLYSQGSTRSKSAITSSWTITTTMRLAILASVLICYSLLVTNKGSKN